MMVPIHGYIIETLKDFDGLYRENVGFNIEEKGGGVWQYIICRLYHKIRKEYLVLVIERE